MSSLEVSDLRTIANISEPTAVDICILTLCIPSEITIVSDENPIIAAKRE